MADDLKISGMVEVTGGDLHDDLQFEVIDPLEAELEDQNKRVKLVTLEASFGAEDKIFEGDSSVEVVDTGTGQVDTTIDGDLIASLKRLTQEYTVYEAETAALQLVLDLDGPNSTVFIGRQAALHARMGIGSDPEFRIMSGTDEWLMVSAAIQRLGNSAAGGSWINITASTDEMDFYINSNVEMYLDGNGMALKAGASVNDIETTLTDDDTHLPTSGAVFDALAGLAPDKIWEGDSSVEVIDTGTGQVVVTVDGNPIYDVLAAGLAFATGSRVNEIEATLTDDDTHIPTSGAVVDAIAAGEPGSLFFGGNAKATAKADGVEIEGPSAQILHIDAATGTFSIETQGNIHLKLGVKSGETAVWCRYDGGVWLYYDNIKEAETVSGGFDVTNALSIAAGNLIDEFETTLTNDANKVPTSSAVVAAIAAITNTKIEQLNTKVEVSDTGTDGLVELVADGHSLLKAENAKIYIGGSDGNFFTMVHDAGHIYITNQFVGGDLHIQGMVTGPTVHTMIDAQPDGGVDLRYNNVVKVTVGADTLELKGDQTGAEAIGNVATTVAVTFGTAHADANYQVICTVENTTDGGPLVLAAIITAKATTGFTATLSAATDSANYVLNWLVVRS